MKRAIYPGSFDPITFGHLDIVKRSAKMFDEIIIAVLNNSAKNSLFSSDERVSMIKDLTASCKNVRVESFAGLTVDFAKRMNANIIIRGLRAVTDFEYELQIAQVNRVKNPDLETVFLTTSLNYSYLSSTVVREFASYGEDISEFVPSEIIPLIEAKYKTKEKKDGK
ncbi:MAG: pantetheine-phosphate adenylyltransferase [Lachnospiraceae bacterium]|nr:pantetheine-phosphate adenylyltransferase [Lachnospiraceae bacterium]